MSFCVKCGEELQNGVNFCKKCGAKVVNENQPSSNNNVAFDNENTLLKKGCSLVLGFDTDSLFTGTGGQIDGKFNVTTERIIFKLGLTSGFASITDENGNGIKEFSIPFTDIERLEMGKFNLIFPKIIIRMKSGTKVEFAFITGGKELFNLIEQQIKIKSQ